MHTLELRSTSTLPGAGAAPVVDSIERGSVRTRGACVTFGAAPAAAGRAALEVRVPPQGILIRTEASPAAAAVRRFADQFQSVGNVPARSSSALRIGPDLTSRPWQLRVVTNTDATVCG